MLLLPNTIAEKIAASILSGEFEPGTQLKEAALAERLGVSRAPLREALRLLEERRLVERLPYAGARVTEFTSDSLADLYELREVLEGTACRRAAYRAKPEDIAGLEAILGEEAAQLDGRGSATDAEGKANSGFHEKIIEISGNPEIQRLLANDFWRYNRIYYRKIWGRHEGRDQARHIEHVRIFEAIRNGDGVLAELLMRRHVQSARIVMDRALVVNQGRRATDRT